MVIIQEKKKQDPLMNNQDQMKSMEDNIVYRMNSLKDEFINLKEIVIRNLQNENKKLRRRYERLEKWCSKYESDHNALAQYGRRDNVVLSGIPGSVSEDVWEESVMSVWLILTFLLKVKILRPVIGLANLIEISRRKHCAFCEQGKLQESFI